MSRRDSVVGSTVSRSDSEPDADPELEWPFGSIDSLRRSDLRETAYEIFFMSCRMSPGLGRGSIQDANDGPITAVGPKGGTGMQVVTSRVKRGLGLKPRRASQPMRAMTSAAGGGTSSPGRKGPRSPGKVKRPMTSAEIMRQQMRVTEMSDNRLRKTLTRTLVGQVGRRAETIILPLELLRQLKPSEFSDMHEYHQWQRRQFRILEAGLILHPPTPLERLNAAALRLRDIIRATETKPIDTSKNSEAMRSLCSSVVSLAFRAPSEATHWADGFPLNIHLYLALLHSIFDIRDPTVVLDEVDELLELVKRTWPTLGMNRMIHNVCLTWTLFTQYVATGQVEPDLLTATLAMLSDVATDAKRADREPNYVKVLSGTLTAIQGWAERRLVEYHESFDKSSLGGMQNLLNLALSTSKILTEDLPGVGLVAGANSGNRIEYYIKSAIRNAFTRILENGRPVDSMIGRPVDSMIVEVEESPSDLLSQLAKETEALAVAEREVYSPVLRRWHPAPGAVAVATLHSCFGVVLKQYLARVTSLTNDLVRVLNSAGKLERVLMQMVGEESFEFDDGGKAITDEMVPYEVESIIMNLLKSWIEERLRIGRECLNRAKETESWIPRSKSEPYAQSSVDLTKLAKVTVDEFFEIPVVARDELVQDLADGLEALFREYSVFVASCGSKQSYIPTLPQLTRCNQESRILKLWKKASPCKSGSDETPDPKTAAAAPPPEGNNPRPSTSRGTQRLYIRLNTLHYVNSHLHALHKSLSLFNYHGPSIAHNNRRLAPTYHFDLARTSIQAAIQQISEIAAYRLVFLDSRHAFYEGLYVGGDIASARIRPTLKSLKQNLTLLVTILTDRAQPLAVKEVMRAAFEAFLMVLLAGGVERAFVRSDYEIVMEDFKSLKRVFCSSGEGLVAEEAMDREAEVVEGVLSLMAQPSERLVEELSVLVGEMGGGGEWRMPPTTGRWNRSDANTVLRVLCHRNDDVADQFLKKTFQLPKRR